MDLKICPTFGLNGEIQAPGSKSYSHRAFIAASLADGVSKITNPLTSGDVGVTINLLKALGVNILEQSNNSYLVEKTKDSFKTVKNVLDCKNSGTTIRIFTALSSIVEGGLSFTGEFLKRSRPIVPLLSALKSLGMDYELTKNALRIRRTKNICEPIKIQGDISSQFITALLIVSPLLKCPKKDQIEIEITTPLVSYPYIKITLDVLNVFGINIQERLDAEKKGKYYITCGQIYRPQSYEIPGDFSSAAFFIAAAALSPNDSKVVINNLDLRNPQGDKEIIEILHQMGAHISINEKKNQVVAQGNIKKHPLKGLDVDCHEIPDLFPILSVIGAYAEGKTTLYNASNLRLKESDRISVMARELSKMGVEVREERDRLTIYKCESLKGSKVEHENDHRIAMACSIAALYADSSSQIKNIEITEDSYPSFMEDLIKLGANVQTQ